MKCFIASAFGHEDVDVIYDSCVVPTLRKLSVTPLRVDRVEHNEEIDNKIFELLDSSDFLIADLTYARPSVYYKAGYATGKSKPVIYTVKGDHFAARVDDLYGNFRVHFDIQMKNIISWREPNQSFSNKLLKRAQHVLRPLERQNQIGLKLQTERDKFDNTAMLKRLMLLQEIGVELLRKQSFSVYQTSKQVDINGFTTPTQETQLVRFNKTRQQAISIIATSSASKRLFNHICYNSPSLYITDRSIPKLSLEDTHYIILSLKSIPRLRVTEGMPYFHLQKNSTYSSGEHTSYNGKTTSKTYVHIVDGIKSEAEFTATFRALIDENGLSKSGG
jgi:nucleoside 2-deoxyribosyltransferase